MVLSPQIPGETALGAAASVCQVPDSCPVGNGVFHPEWSVRNGGRPGIKFKFCILNSEWEQGRRLGTWAAVLGRGCK